MLDIIGAPRRMGVTEAGVNISRTKMRAQSAECSRMYKEVTHSIEVTVEPAYLEEQSAPDEHHFVWAYRVRIENLGDRTVQLVNRYWRITDADGRVQEVRGSGVVGEQPILSPGEAFEYTSGTPLRTSSGIMAGTYEMELENGDSFDIAIPPFSLDTPNEKILLH